MNGEITAVVLAGGRSTRFGSDKASALLRGRPLLDWTVAALVLTVAKVIVVKARGQRLPSFDCPVPCDVVEDAFEGLGPAAGLLSGFRAVSTDFAFGVACDTPLVSAKVVSYLESRSHDVDVVVPVVDGFVQPLFALYRVEACLPVFERRVAGGELKIVPAFDHVRTARVEEADLREIDPSLQSFRNANTPERLKEIDGLLGETQDGGTTG